MTTPLADSGQEPLQQTVASSAGATVAHVRACWDWLHAESRGIFDDDGGLKRNSEVLVQSSTQRVVVHVNYL